MSADKTSPGARYSKDVEGFLEGSMTDPVSKTSRRFGHRRFLASIKRRGGERIAAKLAGKSVLIWSGEHHAWWRPDRAGYTVHVEAAGVYPFEEAYAATGHCDPSKKIAYYEVSA